MLTGSEIIRRVNKGEIHIDNFDPNKVNPNSYNLTLAPNLLIYDIRDEVVNGIVQQVPLDSKKINPTIEMSMGEEGIILYPGKLYIASTNEMTSCKNLIPQLDGRSSTGRLGIMVHATAGFGDIGFEGKWTLEITVVHPVRVYPNQEICQISFHEPVGDTSIKYNGKYQNQDKPVPSKMYKDYDM